jgi:hypothetical protein
MVRTRLVRRHLAVAAAAALVLAACAADDTIGDLEEPVVEPPEAELDEEPDEPDDDVAAEEPDDADGDADAEEPGEVTPPDEEDAGEPGAGPEPDEAALEDPCAGHEDRTDEAFIEVVAPVAEQQVSAGAVELVGCSNVFEANVQWSLYDGDGLELDTGFTTAECGSGCVGAFVDSVPLDTAAGEPFVELHVYAEDAEDGERQHVTAIPLVVS